VAPKPYSPTTGPPRWPLLIDRVCRATTWMDVRQGRDVERASLALVVRGTVARTIKMQFAAEVSAGPGNRGLVVDVVIRFMREAYRCNLLRDRAGERRRQRYLDDVRCGLGVGWCNARPVGDLVVGVTRFPAGQG
jgi:hypothetical protein